MKKFLPLSLFVIVFAVTLGGSIIHKNYPDLFKSSEESPAEYKPYESSFLHANYVALDGKNVEMSKLSAPVIIYNFWASWCMPCLEEMPSMIKLKKRFSADQLQIVAINTDEDDQIANIERTIKKINLGEEFLIIPDKDSTLVNEFKIAAIPVTIIFHRGKVVHFSNGPMDFSSEEIIEKMNKWVSE